MAWRLFCLFFFFCFSCCLAATKEICLYVAPWGSDGNPGTKSRPLATLARAKDLVRRLKSENRRADITVFLRGGVYRLTETVVFTLEDSGAPGQTITYAAYPGERPVLSGALPITRWRRLRNFPEELPQAARGKVWVADVSFLRELKQRQRPSPTVASQMDRGWRFFTLYQGEKRLLRARSKGFTLVRRRARGDDPCVFAFPQGVLGNWPDVKEAELALIPGRIWVSNILPLDWVDEKAGLARTTVPSTYPLLPPTPNALADRPTAWVENALALLDEPGEWVLDSKDAKLYLWPLNDEPKDILAPVLTELVRVEGEIDYDGPQDVPVRNLVFRGLTFAHGDRFPWHGGTGWGLQHDWERFDSPSAMVRFRGAENCAVEDCHFTAAGSSGLRLDLYCQKIRIVGNHFEHLGGVAVLLAGYGPGTKDVNRKNEVSNNLIHNIGELYWGSPAIFVWQSGDNRIAHNHIYNVPYSGICVTGRIVWDPNGRGQCSRTIRWREVGGVEVAQRFRGRDGTWPERERFLHARNNLVFRNDIHDVTQVCGDGNCIYVSGAGAGNVVLENYCHDCPGPRLFSVIRCDDDQHETLIKRNIIFRCYDGRGEGIISKGKNDIIENIVADLRDTAGHRGYLVFPWGDISGSTIQRNVFYSCKAGQLVCNEGSAPRRRQPPKLKDTNTDYNIYFCTEDPEWGERHLREARRVGVEEHSICADPMFFDLEHEDFRFRPGSPALKLGIAQPISVSETGLEPRYRQRLEGK